jgi:hypothetical protein
MIERKDLEMSNNTSVSVDRPWSSAVTRIQSFVQSKNAQVIGITGIGHEVGVSLLCRELAHAYATCGIHSLRVDVSRLKLDYAMQAERDVLPLDLQGAANHVDDYSSTIDLADFGAQVPLDRGKLSQSFQSVAANGSFVIIDLPPIVSTDLNAMRVLGHFGSVCALVLLVCPSGAVDRTELSQRIDACRIAGVPMGGIIVNDWKELGARLAVGW